MKAFKFFRSSALTCALLGGCSVVYPVQFVPNSPLTFDYKNDSYSFKVVDLTPSSALEANDVWRYEPRQIPSSLRSETQTPLYRATSLGDQAFEDCATSDCEVVAQVAQNLDETNIEEVDFKDPPRSRPSPYNIGVGDIVTVTIESPNAGTPAFQREVTVDYAGNIYLTDVGEVNVLGMTVADARQVIADRFRDSRTSVNGSGTVTGFNSQKVVVSSPGKTSSFLPVTTTPITLREAYLRFSSGIDTDAQRQIVVLRRDGESYPIRGQEVLRQSYGYDVYLRNGDELQIFDSFLNNIPSATVSPDVLALNQARISREQFERQEARAEREEVRRAEQADFARRQEQRALREFELAQRNAQRLERSEARADQAESRAIREEARRNEAEARALRDEARRDAAEARALRDQARLDAAEARAEAAEIRARAEESRSDASEARSARQLELLEESDRRSSRSDARDRDRARIDLDIEERDRVFVSGEVGTQQTVQMPFGRQFSLAEAVYGSRGIQPITGDPSRVYVVRAKSTVDRSIESYIFHFDGSNLANISAMTIFEMRPNDYVVVMPRAVTNFSRFVSQILPSFSGAISAASVAGG